MNKIFHIFNLIHIVKKDASIYEAMRELKKEKKEFVL